MTITRAPALVAIHASIRPGAVIESAPYYYKVTIATDTVTVALELDDLATLDKLMDALREVREVMDYRP